MCWLSLLAWYLAMSAASKLTLPKYILLKAPVIAFADCIYFIQDRPSNSQLTKMSLLLAAISANISHKKHLLDINQNFKPLPLKITNAFQCLIWEIQHIFLQVKENISMLQNSCFKPKIKFELKGIFPSFLKFSCSLQQIKKLTS